MLHQLMHDLPLYLSLTAAGVVFALILSFISLFFVGISLLYCSFHTDTTNSREGEDVMNHQWQSLAANELRKCEVMILCGARTHCKCYCFLFDAAANVFATAEQCRVKD